MNRLRKIQLDCRRATSLIEKRKYKKLTFKERLHLLIHLAGCGVCRLFQKQSRWIDRLIRNLSEPAHPGKLDEKFKNDLQEKINQRMPQE